MQFLWKKIQTMTFTSPKGSITAQILVKIFERLDALNLFERGPNKPEPCVIVDGHESRLSVDFVRYINNPAHKWNFALGIPYLTHLWQPGDATEQNGIFKLYFWKYKKRTTVIQN